MSDNEPELAEIIVGDVVPANAAELMAQFIEEHAAEIIVREQIDGRWGSYALTELPPKLAIRHAMRFLIQHRVIHQ